MLMWLISADTTDRCSGFDFCTTEMNYILKYKITLIGVAIGLIVGYLYYYFIGCANGTCSITSKPLNSSLYGGIMGGLIADIFTKPQKK